MTQREIDNFLADTKVYVNGKSEEIQEKLFSLGYSWNNSLINVLHTDKPFLHIFKNKTIAYGSDMENFIKHQNKEITAEQILSIELTEPSYRPFKSQEECWNEMQKHQPFGWLYDKADNSYNLRINISEYTDFEDYFNRCNFADDTPFGIKED